MKASPTNWMLKDWGDTSRPTFVGYTDKVKEIAISPYISKAAEDCRTPKMGFAPLNPKNRIL